MAKYKVYMNKGLEFFYLGNSGQVPFTFGPERAVPGWHVLPILAGTSLPEIKTNIAYICSSTVVTVYNFFVEMKDRHKGKSLLPKIYLFSEISLVLKTFLDNCFAFIS